ncbi:MAG: hypothetical protein ACLQUZ_05480 [Rhizomicrobium sp.]
MAAPDLVTLADVKAWIYKTPSDAATTTNDGLLANLITRASRLVYAWLQRPAFALHTVDEVRSGTGGQSLLLGEWPVVSVEDVAIDDYAVPQLAWPRGMMPGWSLQPWNGMPPGCLQELALQGYAFTRGRQNIEIAYRAGYAVQSEPQTIAPSGTQYAVSVAQSFGPWIQDDGVAYANGAVLSRVTGTVNAGQYALDPQNPGRYLFAAADNGANLLLSYSYTPADVAQAVIEWIAERYAYMGRVGEQTKSAGGQVSVSYVVKSLPDFVAAALAPYRRVVPV